MAVKCRNVGELQELEEGERVDGLGKEGGFFRVEGGATAG